MAFGKLGVGSSFRTLSLLGGAGIPSWVRGLGPILPDIAVNWTKNQAWQKIGGLTTPAALGITTSRASTKMVVDSNGVWTSVLSNVTAISNLGRSTEEARTNSIRNNSMQGAANAIPTNWVLALSSGLSATWTTIATQNGINVIQVRIQGTPGSVATQAIRFDAPTQIAALYGQTWTGSAFVALVSGTLTNISSVGLEARARDSGGTSLGQFSFTTFTPNSTLTRYNGSVTLTSASTAFTQPGFYFTNSDTVTAIDATFVIGWPQAENNSLINSSVASATVQAGGSGGTSGTAVYQVGGGTGTAATLNATVSGGAITAINSVASAGSYTVFPPGPAALTYVSGTGTGVTGATVNLTPTNNAAAGFATSPIVTSGSAAARAADVTTLAVVAGSAVTIWEQGSTSVPSANTTSYFFLTLSDGTTSNYSRLYQLGGFWHVSSVIGGASKYDPTATTVSTGSTASIGMANQVSNQQGVVNNALLSSGTDATAIPSYNQLNFGSRSNGTLQSNGLATIDAIWLNQAVPSAQLQSMRATP